MNFNGGHDDRTPAPSNRLTVLVGRGGRGGYNRNATSRLRITSCRPVAASSSTNPVNPGRRAIETAANNTSLFFFFWHPKPFSFSSQRKRKWVWPPRREARPLPGSGKQQPLVREDELWPPAPGGARPLPGSGNNYPSFGRTNLAHRSPKPGGLSPLPLPAEKM